MATPDASTSPSATVAAALPAGAWLMLAVLCFARLAMGYQFQAIGSVAPLLAPAYGLSLAGIGTLVGLALLPGVLIALPGGLLAARFGERRVAVAGLALMVAGGALMASWPRIEALYAGRLVGGTGAAVFSVAVTKMVGDWFVGPKLPLATAILLSTWPLGIGLALAMLGPIAEAHSIGAAFGATAVFAGLGLLAVLLAYRAPPTRRTVQLADLRALEGSEWRVALLSGVSWATFNVAIVLLMAFLPTLLVQSGYTVLGAGALSALVIVISVGSVQAGGALAARSPHPKRFALVALAVTAALLAAIASSPSPLVWLVLYGLVAGLPAGYIVSLPNAGVRDTVRSAALGVFYTLYFAGMATLPAAAGALADRLGSGAVTIAFASGCVVVALLAIVPLGSVRGR